LRGWWGNPCGFKSRLRHHGNIQRELVLNRFPSAAGLPERNGDKTAAGALLGDRWEDLLKEDAK